MNETKIVLILRGPSGSGKTTWLESLKNVKVVSADHFFMKSKDPRSPTGPEEVLVEEQHSWYIYNFDAAKLPEAHSWCMECFISLLESSASLIAVDNTNIHYWEYRNYRKLAEVFGYRVILVSFQPDTVDQMREYANRNQHRVPRAVIAKMTIEYDEDLADDLTPNEALDRLEQLGVETCRQQNN